MVRVMGGFGVERVGNVYDCMETRVPGREVGIACCAVVDAAYIIS